MDESNVLRMARRLPSGAHFFKCALQVNPGDYALEFQGNQTATDPATFAEEMVTRAAEAGISVLAITNHNDVSGVSAFRDAAIRRGITIFPGFELSSSEGIHILCIYPPDMEQDQLGRFLGEFGIRLTDPSADLSSHSFEEILRKVPQQGGITIAAHASSASGIFKVLSGQARINAWRSDDLLAIQIPGPVDALPQDMRQIVMNKNADYRRARQAGEKVAVGVINAKDVVGLEDLELETATCWIKMSEVTVEGLRQAFLDPDSRIRLNSDLEIEDHAELVAMAWEGGFLDGVAIHFNQNLNVLVGGRGSGKSTVVESLRLALDLDPAGEEARKAHEGLVRHVLRSGTKISLSVRSHRPAMREYRIERTIPNPPIVRDSDGSILNLLPADILPNIEVYGQHEISELSRSQEKLTSLLGRFTGRNEVLSGRKADTRRNLELAGRSLLEVQAELRQIDEQMATLPSLEDTLRRFQQAGLEDRLKEQSLLVQEERILDSIPERQLAFRDSLETLRRELPIDRTFLSDDALLELPGREILTDINSVLEHLNNDLQHGAELIEKAFKRADDDLAKIRDRWDERKLEVDRSYEHILRGLDKSAADGEEFIRLRRAIESLRPVRERRPLLQRLELEHSGRRRALLAEWEEIKAEEFRRLDRAANQVTRQLSNRVQVEVNASGEREPLIEVLKEEVGGRLSETFGAIREAPDFSLPEFVQRLREGAPAVQAAYSIPPAQAERLASSSQQAMMRIEELELPSTTVIRLNTASPSDPPAWQALDDLSTGQKATAVLLLLLLDSDAPLIVDQPEDDLDNRFITEGVVPKIREAKRRRQFVFCTHNANIPVLGDAELILGLSPTGEAAGGRTTVPREHMGSIDLPSVRELVGEILEGGKHAFETRRLKYGF